MGKEILINKMFAGKYSKMGTNVVHEIINLFESDDGKNYIFITDGRPVPEYHDVGAVVLVEHDTTRKVKVVAIAKKLTRLSLNAADLKKITYQNVSLHRIFHGNRWYSELEEGFPDVTYFAEEMWLPRSDKGELFISLDDDGSDAIVLNAPNRSNVVGQSMRWFLSEEGEFSEAYEQLNEIVLGVDSSELWECNPPKRKLVTTESEKNQSPSFLEIIRKEDDELVFSNLIAYYLAYDSEVLMLFMNDFLKLEGAAEPFDILREREHIDILIESANHTVVIENKIGADVIVRSNGLTQLDDYYDSAKGFSNGRKLACFVFAPDYRVKELAPVIKELEDREKAYIIKSYSELFRFFKENTSAFDQDRWRFSDFLRGLERHAVKTQADHDLEFMRSRFLQRISDCQPSS